MLKSEYDSVLWNLRAAEKRIDKWKADFARDLDAGRYADRDSIVIASILDDFDKWSKSITGLVDKLNEYLSGIGYSHLSSPVSGPQHLVADDPFAVLDAMFREIAVFDEADFSNWIDLYRYPAITKKLKEVVRSATELSDLVYFLDPYPRVDPIAPFGGVFLNPPGGKWTPPSSPQQPAGGGGGGRGGPPRPMSVPDGGAGPLAVTWDPGPIDHPASPQSRDRADIAAAQGGGHGDEFFFGVPGGGSILSKLGKGAGGRGLGMDAFASNTGGPRDMNNYAHAKLPGGKGPNPGRGKTTGSTKTTPTAKGPNPSSMASANPPAQRSTDNSDRGPAKDGPVDRSGGGGSTVGPGTTGGGGGGGGTPAPNPPADKSSGGTTTKPTTPGPNPPSDKGSGGTTTTTTTKGGGGGGGTTSPAPPGGGGSKGPAKSEPTKPVETKSDHKKEPPPPPAPPDDHPRRHGSNPNPEDDDRGGGGGPRASGGHNENPNPEDTGGGRGGGGPRAYGGSSRSNLAGPRSYDAYPDPETSGGGGPRGRYNERPNPEDTGSPHGPSARNRSAIGPWSASRNRMI